MIGMLPENQSVFVTRQELLQIPLPPPTATWKPIGHGDLIQAIDRQLMVRGISILEEKFAIQREGARLFGVLDLSIRGGRGTPRSSAPRWESGQRMTDPWHWRSPSG